MLLIREKSRKPFPNIIQLYFFGKFYSISVEFLSSEYFEILAENIESNSNISNIVIQKSTCIFPPHLLFYKVDFPVTKDKNKP